MIRKLLVSGYTAQELGIFDNKHQGIVYIKKAILKRLVSFIEECEEEFWVIISGKWGVEIWAAEMIIDIRDIYPHVKLAIITPFLAHYEKWSEAKQEQYEMLAACADYVDAVSRRKYESPAMFRAANQFLLSRTDALLIVYDSEKAGSPKYLYEDAKKWAETNAYEIITIDSYDLQAVVEEEQEPY